MFNLSLKQRVWAYAVLLSAQPLAAYYGLVNSTSGALWVNLIAAVLTGGVIAANLKPDNQVTVGLTVDAPKVSEKTLAELADSDGPEHRAETNGL